MNLEFENLGPIKKGSIDLSKDLIIVSGQNSSGKTYLSYLVYMFFKYRNTGWRRELDILKEVPFPDLNKYIIQTDDDNIEYSYIFNYIKFIKENLSFEILFSIIFKNFDPLNDFFKRINENFTFQLLNNESIKDFEEFIKNQSITSTRIIRRFLEKGKMATLTFVKLKNSNELLISLGSKYQIEDKNLHSSIIQLIVQTFINYLEINHSPQLFPIENIVINQHKRIYNNAFVIEGFKLPDERIDLIVIEPIQDIIFETINFSETEDEDSGNNEFLDHINKKFLDNGNLSVDMNGDFKFDFLSKEGKKTIDLSFSSGIIKSLATLNYYLKNSFDKNDFLIFDEPEISIHPDLQIEFANLVGLLINEGFKVMITTHSDFIIKQLSNLTALSFESEENKEILENFGLKEEMIIPAEKVGVYFINKNTGIVEEQEITKDGFSIPTMDDAINKINSISFSIRDRD